MVSAAAEKITGAEQIVWDLSPLYNGPEDPAIQEDMAKIDAMADEFAAKYKGRVAQLNAAQLDQAMRDQDAIYELQGRIAAFASLLHSTDTADPRHGALLQKVMEFNAVVGQKLVFFDLEWNQVDDAQARALLDDPALTEYRHYLEAERRYKPYQLSEIEEQLLMDKSVTGRGAWTRFYGQLVSAMRYDLDGEKLTQTQVLSKLYEADRDLRRRAADALTAGLRERAMELTYIFNVLAADKASDDKRRNYPEWISSRNLSNKAPDSVVEALVQSVTGSYDVVARHYHLKRVLLGLDELTDYDRYAPLALKESSRFYTWDEAKAIVLKAFKAFSPRMAEIAQRFFDENWIHAALAPNKRGGAFAHPVTKQAHPYVFVNYNGKASDVSTLAHELGHGIHMYLSAEAQALPGLYTPLTTAEMASVFAEMLVFSDLMAREDDPEVRLSMLAQKIEDTFATVYRQTTMNRFEHAMHTARRAEGELTTERLSQMWMETQQRMFGDSVRLREEYGIWWSYVPHFLNTPGYVYAYAFGELLVLALYNLYKERGADFVPQYIDVLAAGNSDYPDKILAKVGVDLNDPGFWDHGVAAIRALVTEEENIARQLYPEKFA